MSGYTIRTHSAMPVEVEHLFSSNRNPLILPELKTLCIPSLRPHLTVELYDKWYELYLVDRPTPARGFRIQSIHFGHLDEHAPKGETAYVDHVPNPKAVRAFAEANDYHLVELADELITGRWQIEVREDS